MSEKIVQIIPCTGIHCAFENLNKKQQNRVVLEKAECLALVSLGSLEQIVVPMVKNGEDLELVTNIHNYLGMVDNIRNQEYYDSVVEKSLK